jgi:hypothetical protein
MFRRFPASPQRAPNRGLTGHLEDHHAPN